MRSDRVCTVGVMSVVGRVLPIVSSYMVYLGRYICAVATQLPATKGIEQLRCQLLSALIRVLLFVIWPAGSLSAGWQSAELCARFWKLVCHRGSSGYGQCEYFDCCCC